MTGPLGPLTRWLDERREHLPGALTEVPTPILIAAPVAVLGLLLGVGLVSALAPNDAPASAASAAPSSESSLTTHGTGAVAPPAVSASTPDQEPPPRASPAELRAATQAGLPALQQLARKYDRDASVAIAISAAHLKKRDFRKAVDAIARALTLDPELRRDKQVSSVLWVASQNRSSSNAAFVLLEGPMQERGREILSDLSTTKGVRADIAQRARDSLERVR
jgi:hypothetical protein